MRGLMRRAAVMAAGAGLLAAGMVTVAPGAAGAAAKGTVSVIKAPLPANAGAGAGVFVNSVSCASAGNCTAVGHYADSSHHVHGLLLTQTSGRWATGVEPSLPANAGAGSDVLVTSVSCGSAGNCTAVGIYFDSSGSQQGLLLTQTSGAWATGVEAHLPANAGANPDVNLPSVSCGSAGNCTAVGTYTGSDHVQGLLLTQSSGAWATGVKAHLPASAGATPDVFVNSVSCASAGNCTGVGDYVDSSGNQHGLLLTQTSGSWATGVEAPLPANAGSSPVVRLPSVSCASAGNCTGVGDYVDSSGNQHGLLLTQTSGSWATGVKAPLPANAGSNPHVFLQSVSCASAGNCTAIGEYVDSANNNQGMLLTQTSGAWATGVQAPLPANARSNPDVFLTSVSCAAAGNCTALGGYANRLGNLQGLLLTQTAGTWAAAHVPLPAGAATNPKTFLFSSWVSCSSPGNCTAVGDYFDSSGSLQGVLVTETAPATADFSLANSGAPNPVVQRHKLTYTITATNTGRRAAASVKITDHLPATVRFGSVSTTKGSCHRVTSTWHKRTDGTVICQIGTLAPAATAVITIVVRPAEEGRLRDTATATAANVIPDADDRATATVTVLDHCSRRQPVNTTISNRCRADRRIHRLAG